MVEMDGGDGVFAAPITAQQAPLQIFRLQRPSYPRIKKENKRELAFAVFLFCFCLSVLFSFLLSLGCFFCLYSPPAAALERFSG